MVMEEREWRVVMAMGVLESGCENKITRVLAGPVPTKWCPCELVQALRHNARVTIPHF
jgi:hypothetical protein